MEETRFRADVDFTELKVSAHYPHSDKYVYKTYLQRINLDEERQKDLLTSNGFICSKRQNIKKDLKSDDGIFSSKFGPTLHDNDPFINRYKCKCGKLQGAVYEGFECESCKQKVKYVSDNFEYFGWIVIRKEFCLIHPNLYKSLTCLIGKKNLELILDCDEKIDENGFPIKREPTKDNPFVGLGMLGFRDNINEILDFFRDKNPKKIEFYEDIMSDFDKLFTHSIPVYTTQLRPYAISDNTFNFEGNNAIYNLLTSHAARINKSNLYMREREKPNKQILWAMQNGFNNIYADMEKQLSQKKGYIRSLIGGRFNFCARNVIIPDSDLEIDQIRIPYASAIELFQQKIINILSKTYMPSEAYKIWNNARNSDWDETIANLITSIIESEYVGVFINRNPSLHTESIRQMRVVGINRHFACSVPLQVLAGMNADFDGDTINILLIINEQFLKYAMAIFNPRYSGQISNNDGMFNNNVAHQTDTMICLNSFIFLGRDAYSEEELANIRALKNSEPKESKVIMDTMRRHFEYFETEEPVDLDISVPT